MRACAQCQRLYADDADVCPVEGNALAPADKVPPRPDPDDPLVGQTICFGRYEIRRVIAHGAMGRVYQALDRPRNRTVALKILYEHIARDPVALKRFHREFEISANVAHEHIVEVYAFELDPDSNRVLVMEYLEGEPLRALLKRQRVLPPERVVRMLAQMAKGLRVAHEHHLVHRDLKPDNVFLCGTRDGDVVKILDFGSVRDNSEGAKPITAMGTTIGSSYYMAPEQAQGAAELDHRADVWSIAAIAYELLTGKVPFDGPGEAQILLAIIGKAHRLPSDVGRHHGVPRALDDVMDEALAKSPTNRIASVGELVERIGHAYGLDGSYLDWANTPEAELRELLRIARIARVVSEPEAETTNDYSALDAAFDAAFEAETRAVPDPKLPAAAPAPSAPASAVEPLVPEAAPELVPRAVPERVPKLDPEDAAIVLQVSRPAWVVPVAVLVILVIAIFIAYKATH